MVTAAHAGVTIPSAAPQPPRPPRPPQLLRSIQKAGDWKLSVERDRFSGEIVCRLWSRKKGVAYVSGALSFPFGQHADVMSAWVKVDAGAPRRWRDFLPELARIGVAIDGRSMDSPTGGIVWLPAEAVGTTTKVEIQPRRGARSRTFSLLGYASLHDRARAMGCAPEARFVR